MPSLNIETISDQQAEKIKLTEESQFADVKSRLISPSNLTKHISAMANADGGDLYIGIDEDKTVRTWKGFENPEAANGHLQIFEQLFPLGTDFQYEFLRCESLPGLVLHVQINKTRGIVSASNGIPYLRRSAQSLPQDTPDLKKRLEYAKGINTFEAELVNADATTVTESTTVKTFIEQVVPTTTPEPWLKKQGLLRDDRPTVAGVVLFADEPQALLPKHCGVKVYRYRTKEAVGFREALEFTPKTVEGCLYQQIKDSVKLAIDIVESIPRMGDNALEKISYPPQTLHEIITNALIHRDYSIADDVHIRIFDDRIEIQSPGRLPAHVTVKNILFERFARNGALVRLLNKFPDPPNQDVGEGIRTAIDAMHKLGLKEPKIFEQDNNVLVIIRHEPLASPEEAIMDYLQTHSSINNSEAREITHVKTDFRMKNIFKRMEDAGMIEQIPGTKTSNTRYQKQRS